MAAYFEFEEKRPHINKDDIYLNSGHYDSDSKKLILDYHKRYGIETILPSLSIDLPNNDSLLSAYVHLLELSVNSISGYVDDLTLSVNSISAITNTSVDCLANKLSVMQFHASNEKSILSIAQAIEQIVTAFGGNRQPTP